MAGPLTGKEAWTGEQMQRGAAQAVADINAAGGVRLGQQVRLIEADDFLRCRAGGRGRKEAGERRGDLRRRDFCSHVSIPASAVYQAAGVLDDLPDLDQPYVDRDGPR